MAKSRMLISESRLILLTSDTSWPFLDKSLRDERFHNQGLYGTSAILAGLRTVVADVGRRHAEYQAFFADRGMSRHKRQLGATIGIGLGLGGSA